MTLFFLQLWLVILVNASWSRGPNGISDIYPLKFFGRQITSLEGYFYVTLVAFVLIVSFLYLLNLRAPVAPGARFARTSSRPS